MLSKISVLILGIIEEKPLNPYQLNKYLQFLHVEDWFSIATSSVYVTIRNLSKNKYIEGKAIKEGNMPEKTIYSITEIGKKELNRTLKSFLGETEIEITKFNLAILLICHIDKNDVQDILEKKLYIYNNYFEGMKNQYSYMVKDENIPSLGTVSIKHNMYLIETEIKLIKELINEIKTNKEWNNFIAKDIIL